LAAPSRSIRAISESASVTGICCSLASAPLVSAELVLHGLPDSKLLERGRALNITEMEEQVLAVGRSSLGKNEAKSAVADQSLNRAFCHGAVVLSGAHRVSARHWSKLGGGGQRQGGFCLRSEGYTFGEA